uniref:Uncharacterized protein n=1 Tax=Sphaerodactylus townsendi TaxID=933632 RepID=A0ACB8G5S0_9SAUR
MLAARMYQRDGGLLKSGDSPKLVADLCWFVHIFGFQTRLGACSCDEYACEPLRGKSVASAKDTLTGSSVAKASSRAGSPEEKNCRNEERTYDEENSKAMNPGSGSSAGTLCHRFAGILTKLKAVRLRQSPDKQTPPMGQMPLRPLGVNFSGLLWGQDPQRSIHRCGIDSFGEILPPQAP